MSVPQIQSSLAAAETETSPIMFSRPSALILGRRQTLAPEYIYYPTALTCVEIVEETPGGFLSWPG
jgi:hypothetical protein